MTIDANIVIAYLNGEAEVIQTLDRWHNEGVTLYLSSVAESEVLSFEKYSPSERLTVEQFLEENFVTISFDRTIARIAGSLRARTKIKFPDAVIAATALAVRSPVVTRNVKDFRRVPELSILVL